MLSNSLLPNASPLHVSRTCARCSAEFICNAGSIGICQCFSVKLNDAERAYIAQRYDDCLCAVCLSALQVECATEAAAKESVTRQSSIQAMMEAFRSGAARLLLVMATAAMAWTLAAATTGSTALAQTNLPNTPRTFAAGVDTVIAFRKGAGQNVGQQPQYFPRNVFGMPDTSAREDVPSVSPEHICSLGMGGEIIVGFKDAVLLNRAGADFTVFENAFRRFDGNIFAEPAKIAVSRDGVRFVEFPFDTLSLAGCAGKTPTHGNESPLDTAKSGGDRFDLATIGMDSVRFIKITDVSQLVIDDAGHPYWDITISGFDLDAVVGLHLVSTKRTTSVRREAQQRSASSGQTPAFVRVDGSTLIVDVHENAVHGGLQHEHSYELYSSLGVMLASERFDERFSIKSLSGFPKGAYFLVLTIHGERYVEKILFQ